MKIVVIGASNSIIGERGYIDALRETNEVTNLSAGDIPVFFVLSKILTRQHDIAQADYVILDHTISDRIAYFPKLREHYTRQIEDIYRVLMSINPNVICVVFPLNLPTTNNEKYLEELEDICLRHNVHFVNLQPIVAEPAFFEEIAHVHCEVSYLMGLSLSRFIAGLKPHQRIAAEALRHPYIICEARSVFPGKEVFRFKSSLAEADYVVIDDRMALEFEREHQALYIEYVVIRDDPKWLAMNVNGAAHYYGGLDITGDVMSGDASRSFVFSPVDDERELQLTYERGQAISSRYSPMNLVRLIFQRGDRTVSSPQVSSFEKMDFDLDTLLKPLDKLSQSGWFEKVQDISEQSSEIIQRFGQKGMVDHKRCFAEAVENGNKIRGKRMDLFRKNEHHLKYRD
ncbi:hypothetical protein [Roseovarius sp. 2305UL8-3]|uniref:hypothetical protein n=1 Tax=Roseovarius conchicola TaxID=3121636 RepID=UPI0035286089